MIESEKRENKRARKRATKREKEMKEPHTTQTKNEFQEIQCYISRVSSSTVNLFARPHTTGIRCGAACRQIAELSFDTLGHDLQSGIVSV